MSPLVAVIIVNWNGKTDTLQCLASLCDDRYVNKRIIVVDNGSEDDSVQAVRLSFPEVTVLETGINLGFTGGNNAGIEHALADEAEYILLLNNDTTVDPNALTALVNMAEANSQYGVLTPVIHYFDNPEETWFAGSVLDLKRGIAAHVNISVPARTDSPCAIPWASGCAMLMGANLVRQIGGFDERYFLNWEDVDLSLRVNALGRAVGLVPAARVYHKVGRSLKRSGMGLYYYVRNNLLLVSLHSGSAARRAACCVIGAQMRAVLREVKYRRTAQAMQDLKFILHAISDHLHLRYGPRIYGVQR